MCDSLRHHFVKDEKQTRKHNNETVPNRINAAVQTNKKSMSRVLELYTCCRTCRWFPFFVGAPWLLQREEKGNAALTCQKDALRPPPVTPLLSFDSFLKGVTPWLVAWTARRARQRLLLLYCGDTRPEGAMSADSPPPPPSPSGWCRRPLDQRVERNDVDALTENWFSDGTREPPTWLWVPGVDFAGSPTAMGGPARSARRSPESAPWVQKCVLFCFFSWFCFVSFIFVRVLFYALYFVCIIAFGASSFYSFLYITKTYDFVSHIQLVESLFFD